MKKPLLIGLLLALSFTGYAQEADSLKNSIQKNAEAIGHGGNNELKINLLYTVLGIPEISYERLLADNMGVGASILVGIDNSVGNSFAFMPHFRIYFGAKKASGFFIEGNTGLITTREDNYDFMVYPPEYPVWVRKNTTKFGIGAAAGAKFLTRNGFLGEAYLGAGRLFGNKDNYHSDEAYPRIGITIGKRF
ncbi:hypothetical protein WG904_18390 [Pedobacter sp. Du54]|uniref:hypothetical protein n=1 Tax=Pedobacter anseongensis TaxID=3133439 RepID=UPI0030B436A9